MHRLGTFVGIEKVHWPNSFIKGGTIDDIALAELSNRIPLSSTVNPACLTTSDYVNDYGGPLMVCAWVPLKNRVENDVLRTSLFGSSKNGHRLQKV